MVLADGIGGAYGVIGQLVVFRDLADEVCRRLPAGQLLAEEGVEDRAGGVEGLELILDVKSREHIVGVADGQVAGVGVIRGAAGLGRGDDIGELLNVVLCKAVGGALGGSGLQIVQVAVHLLIVGELITHMVEYLFRELLALFAGHVGAHPLGVEAGLVHAHKSDGAEVIIKGAEVILGVGVKSLVEELCDDVALYLQRARGDVHHPVKALEEIGLVRREIRDSGHIDGDDADRAGALAGAEVAAGLLAKLAEVKAQAAAHRADVIRLHIGVDVVGEIGGAVLCGHLEQELVVLRGRPVKVAGDGIGGDGVLEAAAVCVALDHDVDEGLVDHGHLLNAVAVGEVLLLAADDSGQILEVCGHRPVKGYVGEGRLSAPAGGGVHAEDEGLDALLDFLVAEVIYLDKGRQIGIEGRKGLSARPFVLHDAEEVDHLVAEGGKVACRRGIDLARDAQSLLDKLLEAPAGAVAGEHAQVVQVDIAVAVGVAYLIVIDLAEPVVCGDGSGV